MSSRERIARLAKQFRKENEEFYKSPKGWFEKVNTKSSRGQENQKIPDMNEFKMFWGNIWKKTNSIDMEKWSEFMNIIHVKVENEGSNKRNLTMKMLKKTLKKMRPWSDTDWDQIYTFMWQRMTSIHQLLLQIISDLLRNGQCPIWQILARTVLIGKKNKTLNKPEHFRPITCLSVIDKIQASMVDTVLRSHIFSNNIWPFEQVGPMEKTPGAKKAIIFDTVINKKVRMYERNLYVGWTDVRKVYESVFRKFIIEMLNFMKAPK